MSREPEEKVLLLMRHGHVDTGRPRRFLGQTDLPLSSRGLCQAEALAAMVQRGGPASIFSSPLLRARQSASFLGRLSDLEVRIVPELAEIQLGDWEGLTAEEVQIRFPGEYEKRGQDFAAYRPSKGESFQDLAGRVVPALLSLVSNASSPVAVMAHAGVNRVFLAHVLGLPLSSVFLLAQDHACVNILALGREKRQIRAVNLNPDPAALFGF